MYIQDLEPLRYMGRDEMMDNGKTVWYLESYRTSDQILTYLIDELWSHIDLPSFRLL